MYSYEKNLSEGEETLEVTHTDVPLLINSLESEKVHTK